MRYPLPPLPHIDKSVQIWYNILVRISWQASPGALTITAIVIGIAKLLAEGVMPMMSKLKNTVVVIKVISILDTLVQVINNCFSVFGESAKGFEHLINREMSKCSLSILLLY
jgi:hypothetical protein